LANFVLVHEYAAFGVQADDKRLLRAGHGGAVGLGEVYPDPAHHQGGGDHEYYQEYQHDIYERGDVYVRYGPHLALASNEFLPLFHLALLFGALKVFKALMWPKGVFGRLVKKEAAFRGLSSGAFKVASRGMGIARELA
jgi:hypothetical protein